jgi:MFS family permease
MLTQIRSMPRAAWVLFGGTFINRFGTFVLPFLALYLTRRGFSIARAGLAVGAYGAGLFCASLLGGHLADRMGRRNTIALSMFASAAAMLSLSQARAYSSIVVLTWLAGLASELYRPASHALIADLVPEEKRVVAFGLYRFAVNLGFAAGPATAGFLADHSFFYVFLGDAITSCGYGFVALLALPHGVRAVRNEPRGERAVRPNERDGLRSGYAVPLHDRAFMLLVAATVCLTMVDFQMGSTFAIHVKALGFRTSAYGLLISMNGAIIVVFELLITHWVRRFRPQPVIAIGYFLSCFGFALTGLAHTLPQLAATVVVWTMGEMISSPMAGAYAAQLAPENLRGRYMGLLMLSWSFGMLAGPPLGMFAYQHDPRLVWLGCAVLAVTSSALAMWRVSIGRASC